LAIGQQLIGVAPGCDPFGKLPGAAVNVVPARHIYTERRNRR
jgi:hypothetical protein